MSLGVGLFYQGGAGYVAYFQSSIRHERLSAPDRRDLHHYHARGLYSAADFDTAAAVRPHAADSAACGLLFGYLTDFALWAVDWIQCTAYWQQWLVCLAGICLVAVGVSCEVIADAAVLAGEGVVLAVCKVAPIQFSAMKVIFDVTLVVSACALSLAFTGEISGVREGTLAAALWWGR